jgi:AcrR family transcriptional regulator
VVDKKSSTKSPTVKPPRKTGAAKKLAPQQSTARQSAARPVATKQATTSAAPPHWRQARNRVEKADLVRRALLHAAAEVVGEVGYADASISLITQRCGIAQGTFYNYFKSRQDLFDQLLPNVGRDMSTHVRRWALGLNEGALGLSEGAFGEAGNAKDDKTDRNFDTLNFEVLEERGLRGFFSFLEHAPYFFRILGEARTFAPSGYQSHYAAIDGQFLKFLQRSFRNGEFPGFKERELELIAHLLIAARSEIAHSYVHSEEGGSELPEWVVETYMKFILYGLKGQSINAEQSKRVRAKKAVK